PAGGGVRGPGPRAGRGLPAGGALSPVVLPAAAGPQRVPVGLAWGRARRPVLLSSHPVGGCPPPGLPSAQDARARPALRRSRVHGPVPVAGARDDDRAVRTPLPGDHARGRGGGPARPRPRPCSPSPALAAGLLLPDLGGDPRAAGRS